MAEQLRVGIIFGGRSGEHEVSLRSAASIISALDKSKYEIVPIAITPEGKWLAPRDATALLPESVLASAPLDHVAILGDPTTPGLTLVEEGRTDGAVRPLDVVFPVLHGTYGEDGTIQGLLEMAGLAYVGCGVLASAVGMDKILMKQLFERTGLTVVEYYWFVRSEWERHPERVIRKVSRALGFPVFIKPANLGSSVGISRARDKNELVQSIRDAARYDRRIIVERAVDGREFEVSVLGNEDPVASLPGEIIPGGEFYDYTDKYINDLTSLVIPARLPRRVVEKLQSVALSAFRAIDGAGLARVDFFVEKGSNRVILNEINTMPGFTSISMYPKLWEASGISYAQLLDRLIELAIERHADRSRNLTSYRPLTGGNCNGDRA